MCDPCTRAALRAAKALAKSSAARCIQPDAEFPWLPMSADGLRIRTKAADEPLRDIEARELRRYIEALRRIVGPRVKEIEEAVRTYRGAPADLPGYIQRIASEMRGDLAPAIAEAAKPYAALMADAGARAGLAALPAGIPAVDEMIAFGQANPLAVSAAELSATRMGRVMSETLARRVTSAIVDGVASGESIDEMAAWIADEGFTDARATMIARTESAYAYTQGRIDAWKETGVVQGKQWLLAPDPCEFCEKAAQEFGDKAIELDQPFYQQGFQLEGTAGGVMKLDYRNTDGPPLHPNCRCDIIAALDPRLFE